MRLCAVLPALHTGTRSRRASTDAAKIAEHLAVCIRQQYHVDFQSQLTSRALRVSSRLYAATGMLHLLRNRDRV